MKRCAWCFALVVLIVAAPACSRGGVPDSVLEGLHKPLVTGISPSAVRFGGGGFYLAVRMDFTDDDQYVLYLGDHKIGQANRGEVGFSQDAVGWALAGEAIENVLAAAAGGETLPVRITGISEEYDISGDFDRYRDYVSEPVPLALAKGETKFSPAKKLFPEWVHSREPLIRCGPEGNIYLAWMEQVSNVCQAFFSYSRDGGETWSQVLNISRSTNSVSELDLAVDASGHFYLTWEERGNEEANVYFCRSLDHGATWHFPVRVNAAGEYAGQPSLVTDGQGDVFLAYLFRRNQFDVDVRVSVSRDLGNSWELRHFDIPGAFEEWRPLLAARGADSVDLLIAWNSDGKTHFRCCSTQDRGGTWKIVESSPAGTANSFVEHSLLRPGAGSLAYVVWSGSSYAGHYFSLWNCFVRRENSGEWAKIQNLRDLCPNMDARATLSIFEDSVDVVMTGSGGLFLLRSSDQGRNWALPETVSGCEGFHQCGQQDAARHPSGKTYLAYVTCTTPMDGCLYLMSFE